MMSKKVDATLGAFWNYEGVQLRLRAASTRRSCAWRTLGVPTYNELDHRRPPQDLDEARRVALRRFMRATAPGHAALRATPQAGVDALLKADPDLDRDLQPSAVKATLPVFFPADTASRSAGRTRASGAPTATGCRRTSCSSARRRRRRALTNEFLPGQGLADAGAG